jgi:hypothetical protein
MAKIEVTKVEEQRNGRFLFNVEIDAVEGRIGFPIGIQDLGTPAQDEAAVLLSTLSFAEELATSVRLRLDVRARDPEAARTTA